MVTSLTYSSSKLLREVKLGVATGIQNQGGCESKVFTFLHHPILPFSAVHLLLSLFRILELSEKLGGSLLPSQIVPHPRSPRPGRAFLGLAEDCPSTFSLGYF